MNEAKNLSLKEILIRFKPFYKKYFVFFILSILGMLLTAGGTAFSAWLIEPVLKFIFLEKDEFLLKILPFAVILAYLAKSLGLYMQVYFISFVGLNILKELRQKMIEHILKLDMKFFNQFRSGELLSRSTNDINALQSIVSNIIPDFLRESLTSIGLLCVVVYQSPKLAFLALVVVPCVLYPLRLFMKKLKKLGKKSQEKNADLLSRLNEIFKNIELIKANTSTKLESEKFKKENDELCKLSIKSVKVDALISPLMEMMGAVGVAGVIFIGGLEVINGEFDIAKFFSFLAALFMAYTPLKRLSSLYGKLQIAIVASERTFYLLDLKPEIKSGDKECKGIENIEFKDVKFAYEGKKEVLKGVSFAFKKWQMFALAGSSGGGKSSIISFLMHFYDKNAGEILINGVDISEYNTQSLRHKIGLVTQNIYLFNDTIANNIAYSEELNKERVKKALIKANALEFVEQMGGINAEILEHGKNLSGGQKQRIAIARALYKEPDLLIFDEATSALDNESERAIIKTIESLKKDRLVLVIAHRLSTIENADLIAVIDKGEIVGLGDDKELLQTCELYKKFKLKSLH